MTNIIEKTFVEIDLIIPFDPSTYGLYESRKELFRFGKLKIKINSNENTSHNRPHVHANYDGIDIVCSIDNVIEILEPKKFPLRVGNLVQEVLVYPMNLKKVRTAWNEIQSNYKFLDDEINFKNMNVCKKDTKLYIEI